LAPWPQVGGGSAQMDLTLELAEEEHTISGNIEFSTDLFVLSTIQRMAGHLQVGSISGRAGRL
jgi:hypothetical protein